MARWVAGVPAQFGIMAHVHQRQVQAGGRDGEGSHAMFRDYLHRLLGAPRTPEVRAQIVIRLGPQAQAVNLVELAVEFALPRTQELCEHLQRLVERALGLHSGRCPSRRTRAVASPLPDAADDVAARPEEGIEHVDVFGDAHRIMPRQHRDHRSQVHALGDAGDIGQILQRVRHHRVGREVVLDGPDGIETGVVGDDGRCRFLP